MNIHIEPHSFPCRNFVSDPSGLERTVSAVIVVREAQEAPETSRGVRFRYACSRARFCFSKHCIYAGADRERREQRGVETSPRDR